MRWSEATQEKMILSQGGVERGDARNEIILPSHIRFDTHASEEMMGSSRLHGRFDTHASEEMMGCLSCNEHLPCDGMVDLTHMPVRR